ncbi:MAG: type IV toxin-antitoxin system AbiEi family antitoxin domain-containing protein [Coriobacteriia bacterium]|nr:type IV toxin-antitoxin system AbiEi family antitoxin domain-containing protein [Coriobacteriia bacterium]
MDAVLELASQNNGYVTSSCATKAGIPRRKLAEAVAAGSLVQIDRGLYALPDVWEDPYLVAQHRFARGVFSDDTALFLHGMSDRPPFSLTMTFPRAYNAAGAREAGIKCRTCADDLLDLGLCTLETPNGNSVRAYDLERTLCDIVRGQRVIDAQLVTPAMQAYTRRADRDPAKLMRYAKKLHTERKIRNYLEVLL